MFRSNMSSSMSDEIQAFTCDENIKKRKSPKEVEKTTANEKKKWDEGETRLFIQSRVLPRVFSSSESSESVSFNTINTLATFLLHAIFEKNIECFCVAGNVG